MELDDLLGWVGSALFLARLVPQPWRIWRTGVSHGVSVQSAINAAVSDTGWMLYGFAADLPPVWACTLLAIPLDLWTAWLLRDKASFRSFITAALWALVMLAGWIVGGPTLLGTVLGASVLINHAPQVWLALRGDRLGGIAPATWWLAIADSLLWGGYGLSETDPALMAYGVILLVSGIIVLFRLWQVGGRKGLTPELDERGLPDPIENI